MRDVKVLKVYNLVNSKGTKIQLRLGILRSRVGEVSIANADNGSRWSFVGKEIPMPVRSGYWFNGFADEIMLSWLKGNGWYPRSCVCMDDGRAIVYDLPFHDEFSKGNKKPTEVYPVPENQLKQGEDYFKSAIRSLYSATNKLNAVTLYRYVHPCSLSEACRAIDAICGFDNAT